MKRELSLASVKAPLVALRSVGGRPVRQRRGRRRRGGRVRQRPGHLGGSPPTRADRADRAERVPGLSNRFAARWARSVAVYVRSLGVLLRRRVRVEHRATPSGSRSRACPRIARTCAAKRWTTLDLSSDRCTVAVFGGSQGALHVDRQSPRCWPDRIRDRDDLQLLVLTGPAHLDVVVPAASETMALLVRALPFIDRMDLALAVTDLAVARAGAGHIAELTACGLPAILDPVPPRHGEPSGGERPGTGTARGPRSCPRSRPLAANGSANGSCDWWTTATGASRMAEAALGVGPVPTLPDGSPTWYAEVGAAMNHFTPPAGSIPTLQVPTLDGVRAVHLIGIGGAGMRNLARLLLARGIAVAGSDLKDSKGLRELTVAGADVWVGHDGARMGRLDVVIISSARSLGTTQSWSRRAIAASPCGRASRRWRRLRRSSVDRDRRHARQDHHDLDDAVRAGAGRARSQLPDRR